MAVSIAVVSMARRWTARVNGQRWGGGMRVDVERLHGRRSGGVLPIDLIGVGGPEDAVGDKSGLNSARMSYSVM
ncbi:hypothetical protein GGR60_001274 [Xanthomonas arboricola]|uniref:hypothetical protein n=1 Tax=Xanthomonas euroxanthea TaxID=2259622 RepID=UPI001432158A|nr:hypothetical protein [Xanthomonas euroxanthea]NJC36784.1 hypothetical protein [Xanthomonas euroxanthea]